MLELMKMRPDRTMVVTYSTKAIHGRERNPKLDLFSISRSKGKPCQYFMWRQKCKNSF